MVSNLRRGASEATDGEKRCHIFGDANIQYCVVYLGQMQAVLELKTAASTWRTVDQPHC